MSQTRHLSLRPSERRDQVNAAPIARAREGNLTPIRRPGRKPISSGISGKTQHFLVSHHFDVYILVVLLCHRVQTNATCLPSGENDGWISKPVSVVRGTTRGGGSAPPSRANHRPAPAIARKPSATQPSLLYDRAATAVAAAVPVAERLPRVEASERIQRAR